MKCLMKCNEVFDEVLEVIEEVLEVIEEVQ